MNTEQTRKAKEDKKLISEAFRLNRGDAVDREIIEFLSTSNNKSALIKDAICMYREMVNRGLYTSPFIRKTATDWDRVIANLNPSDILMGRRPETVKEEVKQEIREYNEYKQKQQAAPVVADEPEEDNFEGNSDNELNF